MPPEQNCPPVKVRVWVGQFLPKENYLLVRVGVWVKVRVSFRVGEKTANCPRGKLPSARVRVGVWVKVRISFRVWGKPANCPRGKLPLARVRVWIRVSFRLGVNFPRGKLT